MVLPKGVVSKNSIGNFNRLPNIKWCNSSAAFSAPVNVSTENVVTIRAELLIKNRGGFFD